MLRFKLVDVRKTLFNNILSRMRLFITTILTVLLIGIFTTAASQKLIDNSVPYNFRDLNVNHGLSNNTIYALVQDKNGFLWIGTENGLNRFDSEEIVNYFFNPFDTTGLSNSKILSLLSDDAGRLWIGTAYGLNQYSFVNNNFREIFTDKENNKIPGKYIRCLFQDSDSDIWVGTSTGLSLLRSKSCELEIINVDLNSQIKSNHNIVTIFEDKTGIIWIGTTQGLYYSRNKKDFYHFPIKTNNGKMVHKPQIRSILEYKNYLLVATEGNGLFSYNNENGEFNTIRLQSTYESINYRDLLVDRDSNLWVSSTEGLYLLQSNNSNDNDISLFNSKSYKILDNSTRFIFEDYYEGIWIGTQYNGLFYHYSDNFLFDVVQPDSTKQNTLNYSVVSAFYPDGEVIWIGTDGGGINVWNRKDKSFYDWTEADGLINNNVKCLGKDWKNRLWIGTYKGLSILNKNQFLNYDFYDPVYTGNKFRGNQILSIWIDNNKKTGWLGTEGMGLITINPDNNGLNHSIPLPEPFSTSGINTIKPYQDSLLLLGTSSGLLCYNPETRIFSRLDINIPRLGNINPFIISMELMDDGLLWLGTEKYGLLLYRINEDKANTFTQFTNIPGITINSIKYIKPGVLWCSTNQGLSRVNFSQSGDSLKIDNISFYSESYGIQSKQFIPRSAAQTNDGELFFGGINGFNYFHPREIHAEIDKLDIFIKSISYRDKRKQKIVEKRAVLSHNKKLEFKHYIRDISFEFAALNYAHPEMTKYAYRVIEEGNNWIDLGSRNILTFNNLSKGTYNIEIRATNKHDSWTEKKTSVKLTILPAPWKTGYAFGIYSLIILLLLLLFYKTISRWEQLKSSLRFQQVRHEQDKQLHEQRIRFYTDISHELRTPLTLILSPLDMIMKNHSLNMRVLNSLQMVKKNGEKMLQLINQLLDLRKADAGHLQLMVARKNIIKIIHEILLSFKDTAYHKNIDLQFLSAEKDVKCYFDKDKIEIIITNLLSNAIKHTPERGEVILSVEAHPEAASGNISKFPDGFVQIIIQDSGHGIPKDQIDKIFDRFYQYNNGFKGTGIGLELTKKYIELHGGSIHIESQVAQGGINGYTKVIVKIPLGRKHIRDEQILHSVPSSEDVTSYINKNEHWLIPELEKEVNMPGNNDVKNKNQYKFIIIEDNHDLREFLIKIFGKYYETIGVENGKIAWDKILEDPPDIIISDIMMPEMDGIELCRRVKTDVRTSHIPVILLTARTAITFKYEGLETGADEYITKPFEPDFLLLKARNLLFQRETLRRKYLKDSITEPEAITLTSIDEKVLKSVIDYIHGHMDDANLNVENISDHLGMSRVHFYRKIKTITGVSPQEFIKSIKLKYAAKLISQNKARISEIAYMCGYKDPAYFSKTFKEFYGESPSDYANKRAFPQ